MTRWETTGVRPSTFSTWHRTLAHDLVMVDVDACEYCARCSTPLALYEVARDSGNEKPAHVTTALARMAGLPAYTVLYRLDGAGGIEEFRVRGEAPERTGWLLIAPETWAWHLRTLRLRHTCGARP